MEALVIVNPLASKAAACCEMLGDGGGGGGANTPSSYVHPVCGDGETSVTSTQVRSG